MQNKKELIHVFFLQTMFLYMKPKIKFSSKLSVIHEIIKILKFIE